MKAVLDFLTDINPDLEYNVFPLQDLYGPTKDDPKFQVNNLSFSLRYFTTVFYKYVWLMWLWILLFSYKKYTKLTA